MSKTEIAQRIMHEDRDILRALASDFDAQMPVARDVMARRKRALKKLAK